MRADTSEAAATRQKRARLEALAAGGKAQQFTLRERGRPVTVKRIEGMSEEYINKLYARYEAKLRAAITKTLGTAGLQIAASMFLPRKPTKAGERSRGGPLCG